MDDPRAEPTEKLSLPGRLRERKLVQWALAYLAGGWVVLEVVSTLQDGLGWPSALFPILVGALSVGFVITLVLAWYHGEQGRQRVSGPELLIIAGILGVSGLLVSLLLQPNRSRELTSDDPATADVEASVAVIPFRNMSGNEDNEYFSDGITAEIVSALAQLPDLRVLASTTSFAFKGQGLTIQEIADTLDVTHVVDGSVRRDGGRVLITAQLIDALRDRNQWSETYQRDLDDIFALQREIAGAIADELQVELSGSAAVLSNAVPTTSQEAHDLYLRGRYELNQRGANIAEAIRYFEQAVEVDSTYARALGGLALANVLGPTYGVGNPAQLLQAALEAADRALALDSTLSEPHTARGYLPTRIGGVLAAERELRRAVELEPNDANAHHFLGWALMARGMWDEAEQSVTRAILLDPSNPAHRWRRGNLYYFTGRSAEAEADVRAALRISPEDPFAQRALVLLLTTSGQVEALRALSPDDTDLIELAGYLAEPSDPDALDEALRRLAGRGGLLALSSAMIAARADRRQVALDLAEGMFEGRTPTGTGFALHSALQALALTSLSEEPRFQAILDQMRIGPD